MEFERAVRFGFVGAVGVLFVSLGTYWMYQLSDRPASPVGEAFIFVLVAGLGLVVALSFVFGLMEIFVDEKLADRDGSTTED